MFRKLVSHLPYSPALVGQLSFYARRLRKEELTRRLGLVLTILALVVQSFAVISPPEAANASNASDFIRGGVKNINELLEVYDQSARGNGDFKDIMDYAGVTRDELKTMKEASINSLQFGKDENGVQTWGREHRFSSDQGEIKHITPRSAGGTSTVYSKPLWLYDSTSHTRKNGSTYKVFVGYSKKIGWFAVNKDCGNLLTRKAPHPAPGAQLLSATCDVITGYAYDARRTDLKVNVFLYFNGPPGKGEKVGPILANASSPASPIGNGHGFNLKVPDKYRKAGKAVPVYGVMVPLAGWSESTVPFKNSGQIPVGCYTPPKPIVTCAGLKVRTIERTKFSLAANAAAQNGATINEYVFTVMDSNGKSVVTKSIKTSALEANSGVVELKVPGSYTAKVVIKTSAGDIQSDQCNTLLSVAAVKMCRFNPELAETHPDCQPCPANKEIWIKSPECQPNITQSKEAKNLTQNGASAENTTVNTSDRIEYTIYLENIGSVPATVKLEEKLSDVLEYSTIRDAGGAQLNSDTHVLSWGDIVLQPNQKEIRKFSIQVNDVITAAPRGVSEPASYDCIMTNAFGNTINIRVQCPVPKVLEQTTAELPKTGPTATMVISSIVTMIVAYLYARSRQMSKEVRLVKQDFNAGSL